MASKQSQANKFDKFKFQSIKNGKLVIDCLNKNLPLKVDMGFRKLYRLNSLRFK